MKKIVITGGTGLIGRSLVAALAAADYQVVVLSRNPDRAKAGFPSGVSFIAWDAKDTGAWVNEINGAAGVINLAGESIGGDNFLPDRWSDKKRREIRQSRLDIAEVLIKAIEEVENKPDVFLQASAIGFYGVHGDDWVDEKSAAGTDFLASVTSDHENATMPLEKMGVRSVLMRTGLVLTPDGGTLARMMVPFKFFVGGPYGNGRQWYSWVHVADVVKAIIYLLENPQISGPVNIVSPNPVTNKDFAKTLGKVMNRPSLIPVPSFAMKILTGDAAILVLDGQRVSSKYLESEGFRFDFSDLHQALNDLIS